MRSDTDNGSFGAGTATAVATDTTASIGTNGWFDLESCFSEWNGEQIIIRRHPATGSWIFVAVHSIGESGRVSCGTRMRSYASPKRALQDALRLSTTMSYKLALAGIEDGGGKAVLCVPEHLSDRDRTAVLQSYGNLIKQLHGTLIVGPDFGTSSVDMNVIAEVGATNVFSRTADHGGVGDSGVPTALGVATGMTVACERFCGASSLAGKRIAVQGAGKVGRALIARLVEMQADVVFADVDGDAVEWVRSRFAIEAVPPDRIYDTPCDIFSPCALGGVINETTIARLRCKAVVGGANDQLATPEDASLLSARRILFAPDIVVSIGGFMAVVGQEDRGWSKEYAEERVVTCVRSTLREVFQLSMERGVSPDECARAIARRRLYGVEECNRI